MSTRPKKRLISEEDARLELRRYEYYKSQRANRFDELAKESWELFHNAVDGTDTQYDRGQLAELEDNAAPDVSMNFIYPILQQQKALLTSDVPMGRVLAEGGAEDKQKAYVYEKLCNAVWRRSKASAAFDKAIKEMIICGISAMVIEPTSFYKPGVFELTIDHVSWENIFIDPDAKETGRGFRDAEAVIIAKRITQRKAENIYGYDYERDRHADHSQDFVPVVHDRDEEENNRDILLRTIYEKTAGVYLIGRVATTMEMDGSMVGGTYTVRKVFKGRAEDIDALREKWVKELKLEEGSELYIIDAEPGVYVNIRTIIGSRTEIYNELLPLTEYPFAFFTADDYNSPYVPSPASYLRSAQHAMNKFYQIVIVNALLSSNTRMLAPEGAITDRDEFDRNIAAAGGLVEYRADETLPNGGRPEPIRPEPLSSAFYTMAFDMKNFMEYNSGIFGVTQGDPSNAPDVYSSLASLQSHATTRSKNIRARVERSMSYLWKAAMEYMQYFGDRNQIIRYLDDFGREEQVPVIDILDDQRILRFDVQTSVKVAFPTDRQEMVRVLQTALSQIGDPQFQKFGLRTMLEMMDYPITDELLKELDINDQLGQQLQQLQEQLRLADARIAELSQEVIVKEKKAILSKFEQQLDGIREKTQAKAELAIGKLGQQQEEPAVQEV